MNLQGPSIFAARFCSGEDPWVKGGNLKLKVKRAETPAPPFLVGQASVPAKKEIPIQAMAGEIVKRSNDRKGCGFIEQKGGLEVFVRHSGINAARLKSLDQDGNVIFDVE